MSAEQPIPTVVGPTASGKSSVALLLAERIDGEIISCDSVQVYRGFEIGSAKPSAQERNRAVHHLVDVADWHEAFDAERYRRLARAAIEDVRARNKIPIICGGTGLYLRVLRWGLVRTPRSDPDLRERLRAEESADPGALYARLNAVDPQTATRTEPNNLVHVIRALEICELSGELASVVRARHGFGQQEVPMQVRCLWWDNALLRQRIAERTATMLGDGLCEEVSDLLARGVDPASRPMRAVGYREVVDVLEGGRSRQDLAERIQKSTWDYARRQKTWFRKERDVQRIDVGGQGQLEQLAAQWAAQIKP